LNENTKTMKQRWTANTWVLATLLGIIVVAGVEAGRQILVGSATEGPRAESSFKPGFDVGAVAPDFTLPDSKQKPHRLSELIKKDTLLCFTCGCENCRQLQTYLSGLRSRMKAKAPQVISVTTALPDAEEAYIRDTGLPHLILYEAKESGTPVMELYKGHPCPRVYRLHADRKVAWISPSPGEVPPTEVGLALAAHLGFDPNLEREKGVEAGAIPRTPTASEEEDTQVPPYIRTPDLLRDREPKKDKKPESGHGPGDGHGH
jgi:AhpC/TSA family protein